MPFDIIQYSLDTVLPLCEAAYFATPTLPPGYTYVAPITVDTSILPEPKGGVNFGFIADGPEGCVIVFRGTEDPEEWLCDLDAAMVEYGPTQWGSIRVHCGFNTVFRACIASILPHMDVNGVSIYGHSLGGALTVLTGYELKKRGYDVKLYRVASPHVGNAAFCSVFDPVEHYRICNAWDLVAHVPDMLLGFTDNGHAVLVDSGFCDFKRAHSMPLSYAPGLAKLLKKAA